MSDTEDSKINEDNLESQSLQEQMNWEEKAQEYLTDLKRVQADFENYKKRIAKEQSEMTKFMIQGILGDLFPILDNFHAAVTHVPEGDKESPWVTGITYIEKQFEAVLESYGVKPLEVKVGDVFDPGMHEAISQGSSEPDKEDTETRFHTIKQVVQKGYTIGDKVVRAAKVIVQ